MHNCPNSEFYAESFAQSKHWRNPPWTLVSSKTIVHEFEEIRGDVFREKKTDVKRQKPDPKAIEAIFMGHVIH